jgi:hemerythrin-like metal-binding protein
MSLMTWNDNLLTGIAIVDQQHRGLVDLVNEAAPILALSNALESDQLQPLLNRLFDYAAAHFKTEEDLMAASGIDARVLAHHRRTHAHFVEQVSAMAARFTQAGGISGEQLLSFLAGWLVFHILGEDQTMARQLKAIKQGSTSDQAYVDAEGARITPSPRALTHALVHLYTQLHRQNHELDQHRNALQELVHERTAALEKTTDELRQSRDAAVAGSLAKSRFLGIMSHELRTPMNAILGFSQLMLTDPPTPRLEGLARKIVTASEHLLELINGVIDYASLEAGQGNIEQTPFELKSLLAEACHKPFEAARNKGIAIRQTIDPALPAWLKGDARHIATVLRHFAGNAAKFTQRGSIELRIELRVERRQSTPSGGLRVRFSITDSGIGIAPEKQPLLFEAFSQLDNKPTRSYEGIGLGLALVRQLARLMSAETGMQSQPGQGSCFWLELDLQAAQAMAAKPDVSPPQPTASVAAAQAAPDCDVGAVLKQLTQLLSAYDTRTGEVFDQYAACLRQHLGERHAGLARDIATFDFDAALKTVQDLTQSASKTP